MAIVLYSPFLKFLNTAFITGAFNTFLSTELGYILQHVDFIVVDIECLSQDYVKTLKTHNRKIFVYTCEKECHYEFIKPFKVDGIVSDILLNL